MRTTQLLCGLAVTSSITSAWPWPPSLSDIRSLSGVDRILYGRQDNDNADEPASSAIAATSGPSLVSSVLQTTAPTSGAATTASKTTGARTTDAVETGTITASAVTTNAWPGGVNILSPNTQLGGSQYYAISSGVNSTVTWIWNYTSLANPPAYIDVVATMASSAGAVNPSPFTIGSNLTWEKTQTFTWDTGDYAKTSAMPSGIYTLNIFDADNAAGATAVASGGYLSPFKQWYFGVYTPLPYYVLEPTFQCATCNAAGGSMDRLAWGSLAGTVSIVMATMLWFTGMAGLW